MPTTTQGREMTKRKSRLIRTCGLPAALLLLAACTGVNSGPSTSTSSAAAEGIGVTREQIIDKLRLFPLRPFRVSYGYTTSA